MSKSAILLMLKKQQFLMRIGLCACTAALLMLSGAVMADAQTQEEKASDFVQFVEDFPTGVCVQRQGKGLLIKSTHATRKIKVVLDRYTSGVGTGDRSRSVLSPSAEPEALGCSRTDFGSQEWRIVRAEFVD